jgi:hypothetical protein
VRPSAGRGGGPRRARSDRCHGPAQSGRGQRAPDRPPLGMATCATTCADARTVDARPPAGGAPPAQRAVADDARASATEARTRTSSRPSGPAVGERLGHRALGVPAVGVPSVNVAGRARFSLAVLAPPAAPAGGAAQPPRPDSGPRGRAGSHAPPGVDEHPDGPRARARVCGPARAARVPSARCRSVRHTPAPPHPDPHLARDGLRLRELNGPQRAGRALVRGWPTFLARHGRHPGCPAGTGTDRADGPRRLGLPSSRGGHGGREPPPQARDGLLQCPVARQRERA